MAVDWISLCAVPDFTVTGSQIDVRFSDERHHQVTVTEDEQAFFLTAIVVKRSIAAEHPDIQLHAWQRNRVTSLVGFRMNGKHQLVGEAWVPKAGITASEFQLYVRTVAIECDRFEYLFTGSDTE